MSIKHGPEPTNQGETQEVLTYEYAKGYLPTENPKQEEIDLNRDGPR
ncbi:hypothetical protein [Tumebacillus flagellatus]|nr:hypothetical protein [Tumebacillus flagellatus]